MKLWIKIIAGVVPAAVFLLLFILLLCRLWRQNRQQQIIIPQSIPQAFANSKFGNIHSGINKFHLSYKSGSSARKSLRFHNLNNHHHHNPAISPPANFNWDDNPRFIAEAVETGWPRFAFSGRDAAESSWEISSASSEFMQTVRFNPAPNRTEDEASFSFVRTSLPLPGPALGGAAFPQEAYFEITIVYLQSRKKIQPNTGSKRMKNHENDRAKLIRENSATGIISASKGPTFPSDQGSSGEVTVALGLISSGATAMGQAKPGTFQGSIGFHSNGSVFLDGRKLVFESEKTRWDSVNRVIGCGFEPMKKKVFFTVDSSLAHVIRCTSAAYGNPLFPVIAADADAMFLVNLGQAPFKYAPANSLRMPNPCFLPLPAGEAGGGPSAGFADSRELFSVSRMEGEWVDRISKQKNSISKKSSSLLEDNFDAESDLFEISLQG